MTLIYNRTSELRLRRKLRKESTEAEILLWKYVRNKKLNNLKFRRQYSVNKYVLDFYCPSARLAVELDGEIHLKEDVKIHDEIRDAYIRSLGIRIIRIKNEEVFNNIKKVLKLILDATSP
jgi:very-short-patch-repair endonuclease